jgi:hypothetical protein
MKLTRLKTATLAACAALAFTSAAVAADVKATMIIYLDPSVQFFNPSSKAHKMPRRSLASISTCNMPTMIRSARTT